MLVPLLSKEQSRLAALARYNILDTLEEQAYDDIVNLAAFICETPIALISLVDTERQWFKARVGLEARETPREYAFCAHAIHQPKQVMIVQDATLDRRFSTNPLVTGDPSIRFYAGAPLVTPAGEALGTVCVIDRVPRVLDADKIEGLRALSRQVVAQLELRRMVAEMERLAEEQSAYQRQLEEYQRQMERVNAELMESNSYDSLTGIHNRQALETKLQTQMGRAESLGVPLSLLLMDVDNFKLINDNYGHQAGDAVLRKIAELIRENCRDHDVCGRYGGEEFAVILPDTGLDGACVLAERFRRAIEKTRGGVTEETITISIGAATLQAGQSMHDLVHCADQALYHAKEHGRNKATHIEQIAGSFQSRQARPTLVSQK